MNAPFAAAERPARILIVDDQRQNRHLLEVMLSNQGFVLQSAARGDDALAVVAEQHPDLILLDVMMPGMDGYQVAAAIKGNLATRHITVLMFTSLHDDQAKVLGTLAGVDDFLSRPVARIELLSHVRNLLRLKPSRDGDR
jgi:PleD family two-component response regulator